MQTVITGTIHQGDFKALDQLMRDWSSCFRYAYQRIHKNDLKRNNDAVKACKPFYMARLNQRYIQDAVLKAKAVTQEHALFGGKRNWHKMISGLITKTEWHQIRDSELYSRGDRTKQGNPNIRVINTGAGYKLRVGLPGYREFLYFTLYIPEKFQEQFELYRDCYDVRVKRNGDKYYIYIGLEISEVKPIYVFFDGCLGIDTNPDGLAVVEIGRDGNLISHEHLQSNRLLFARHDKRKNDIEALALQVVNRAVLKGKGIVLEDLKFNQGKKSFKKFNRMRHNFIYAQLLQAIERRAIKDGVEIRKINPAFTSITGILKYQEQYSLNRHTAAALVIARRGFGIIEKVRVKLESLEKDMLNLAGRSASIVLTKKAYSYFKVLYRVFEVETPGLTAPCLSPPVGNYGTG